MIIANTILAIRKNGLLQVLYIACLLNKWHKQAKNIKLHIRKMALVYKVHILYKMEMITQLLQHKHPYTAKSYNLVKFLLQLFMYRCMGLCGRGAMLLKL